MVEHQPDKLEDEGSSPFFPTIYMERYPSGLRGRFAKALDWLCWCVGSNPTLSAN